MASTATAATPGTAASSATASASRVSTVPGPTSRNVRAPAAIMLRTWSANATGFASCPASRAWASRGSAGYGSAVVFENTGTVPRPNSTPPIAARNGAAASATSGLWNAAATGSRTDFIRAAANACCARSISGVAPDTTDCFGPLRLATTMSSLCSAMTPSTAASGARTASMVPGSPGRRSPMSRPRSRDRWNRSAGANRSAAARATNSP